jgi:hypothetical protein
MSPLNTAQHVEVPEGTFSKPVLSICITTYNRSAWLAHSLPLILLEAAPFGDAVEVIVCDNASTDDTPAVTAGFRGRPNLRVHRNERNVGMLGNLRVSAEHARGQYVWVIGDDDLMIEGTVSRVLSAIALHPDVELIYTNYAYTLFDRPRALSDVGAIIHGALPISSEIEDAYVKHGREISTKSINCFTAIYCVVFRADHANGAYGQDTSGPPFSSLATCVPTTKYVIEQLFDRPAYWIGDPCVVVNQNVSWTRFAALYILERFPEIFDRMQEAGAPAAEVDGLRAKHLPSLGHWVAETYFGAQREHLPGFSMERLVRRFSHLPEFSAHWPKLRSLHADALTKGFASVQLPGLEVLDAIVVHGRATSPPQQR